MGLLGRARVRKLYDIRQNVDTMLALYEDVSARLYKPRKKKKPLAERLADFLNNGEKVDGQEPTDEKKK